MTKKRAQRIATPATAPMAMPAIAPEERDVDVVSVLSDAVDSEEEGEETEIKLACGRISVVFSTLPKISSTPSPQPSSGTRFVAPPLEL